MQFAGNVKHTSKIFQIDSVLVAVRELAGIQEEPRHSLETRCLQHLQISGDGYYEKQNNTKNTNLLTS